MMRWIGTKRFGLSAALLLAAMATAPAHAVNKDMVQLQTQVQELQDAIARLQQSNDERMGVLKDLVQQSADSVNKMSLTIDTLQKQLRSQQEAASGKVDQVSSQVQALNDSVDEVKARLNRIDKALQDIQNQQQSINGTLQNMAPGSTGAAAPSSSLPATPGTTPNQPAPAPFNAPPPATQQAPIVNKRGKPSAGVPMAASMVPDVPAATASVSAAPPASDLYKSALSDYMAAKYPLSATEFGEIVRTYPDDALAGNSYYYLGEIDYRTGKFSMAVKDYDHVLDQFPDSSKVPVSHLHKGMALFALKQNDAGIRELRSLITRFPNSPEATQARSRLNGMGVPIVPRQR